MKNVGIFLLFAVWSFFLATSANASTSDTLLSPTFQKPLNYASVFSAIGKEQSNSLEFESHKILVQQSAVNNIGYMSDETYSGSGDFSISPYWFYALKIIVLLVVLMWDDQDKARARRKGQ